MWDTVYLSRLNHVCEQVGGDLCARYETWKRTWWCPYSAVRLIGAEERRWWRWRWR